MQETIRERCLYDLLYRYLDQQGEKLTDAKIFFAYLLYLREKGLEQGDLSETTAMDTLLKFSIEAKSGLKECSTSQFSLEHTTMWAPAYDLLLEDKTRAK